MMRSLAPAETPVPPSVVETEAGNNDLFGTWRLMSFTQKILATGETIDVFGKAPQGFINYGRDGRMMVLMVKDARPKPSELAEMTGQDRVELFMTMVASAGPWTRG